MTGHLQCETFLYHLNTAFRLLPSSVSKVPKPLPVIPPLCALVVPYIYLCSIAVLFSKARWLVVPWFSGFVFVSIPLASLSILSILFISPFQTHQGLYLNHSPALQIPCKSTIYDLTPLHTPETFCGHDNHTLSLSFILCNQCLLQLFFFSQTPNVDIVQIFQLFSLKSPFDLPSAPTHSTWFFFYI